MNESTPPPDPESQITAYLFGETTPAENVEIEARLKTDTELQELMDRLRKTIDLIGQAEPFSDPQPGELPESLQFSPERREAILKTLSSPVSTAKTAKSKHAIPWYLPLGIAAVLMLTFSYMAAYMALDESAQPLAAASAPASKMYFFDSANSASAPTPRPRILASTTEQLVERDSAAPLTVTDFESEVETKSESARVSTDDRFARFGLANQEPDATRLLSEVRLRGAEAKDNQAAVTWGMQSAFGREASVDGLESNLAAVPAGESASYYESLQRGEPSNGRSLDRGLGLEGVASVQTQPAAPGQAELATRSYDVDASRLADEPEAELLYTIPNSAPTERFRSRAPQSGDRGRQQVAAEFGGLNTLGDADTTSGAIAGNYSITSPTPSHGIQQDGFGSNSDDGATLDVAKNFAYKGVASGEVPMGNGSMGSGGMGGAMGGGGGAGGGGAGGAKYGGFGGGQFAGAAVAGPQSMSESSLLGLPEDSYSLNELEALGDIVEMNVSAGAIRAELPEESMMGEPLALGFVEQKMVDPSGSLAFGDQSIEARDLNTNAEVAFQRLNRDESLITESLRQAEPYWSRMDGEAQVAQVEQDSKALGRGFSAPAPAPSARPSAPEPTVLARIEKESNLRRSRLSLSVNDAIAPLEDKTTEDFGMLSEFQLQVPSQDLQTASQRAKELAQVNRKLTDEVALLPAASQPAAAEEAAPSVRSQQPDPILAPIVLSKKLSEQKTKTAPQRVAGQQVPALKTAKPESELRQARGGRKKPETPKPQFPPLQPTDEQPTSTFSLNVSDVSFKLAAASLERGVMPEVETIRPEEFFNAMTYHDPVGHSETPVAVHTERARYPFGMQQELLRIAVRTKSAGRQSSTPLNLVLLLDNSGSMERPDRQTIVRRAMESLLSSLKNSDQVSILTFARTPRLWVDGLSPTDALNTLDELTRIIPEGGTNLEEAMSAAYAIARKHFKNKGQNRVILLTDGAANLGNTHTETLRTLVTQQRQQGIALDSFGIGWDGYDDQRLEALTRNGDGRYSFLNNLQQVESDFIQKLSGALNVAAKNVKVQITFNPQRVSHYRQIGYAKHQLTKEQFRDNRVDAAELAAEEAGTALYVLTLSPDGSGPVGDLAIRYQDPASLEFHELNWALPYPRPAQELQDASTEIQLATAAALFAERLAGIPYTQSVSFQDLSKLIQTPADKLPMDPTISQLKDMIAQAQRLSGF